MARPVPLPGPELVTADVARGPGCGLRPVARMMMARVAMITLPPRNHRFIAVMPALAGPGNECSAGSEFRHTFARISGAEAGLKAHDVSFTRTTKIARTTQLNWEQSQVPARIGPFVKRPTWA